MLHARRDGSSESVASLSDTRSVDQSPCFDPQPYARDDEHLRLSDDVCVCLGPKSGSSWQSYNEVSECTGSARTGIGCASIIL